MRVSLAPRMLVVAGLGAGAWAASPATAYGGERVRARLSYAPDADIARCPTERELKDAVASRIGYDPFEGADATSREVIVEVHRRAGGIVGLLELRGPRPGQRELSSPSGDCRELLDAFAVAIAIGIDPTSLTRPPGERPPEASAPPEPSAAPVAPPIAAPAPPSSEQPSRPAAKNEALDVRLGAGPLVIFGELPATAPALAVTLGVRWRWLEPTLEALAALPASLDAPAGRITASLLAASFVPCGHAQIFFGCLGFTLGALRGEGERVAMPLRGSQLYSAASARAGAELELSRAVWLRGYVEAVAPVTRITLQLASQDVWIMPSVAARVGAAAGIRF